MTWVVLCGLLIAAVPLARLLSRGEVALTLALMPMLSVGAISLAMLWPGLLNIPLEPIAPTLLALALLLLPPLIARIRGARGLFALPQFRLPETAVGRIALLICAAVSAAALFNALYWPFHRADTLGIYHVQAAEIYATRALLPLRGAESLYLTYPMLAQLHYAYAYLLSGWVDEYAAKLGITLVALACLPATYALGKAAFGTRAGWLAAALLATMPTFGRWASAGYVDLPMAAIYAIAGVFALRCWQSGKMDETGARWSDAIAAGGLIGLATFTKNAALLGVPVLALWLVIGVASRRVRVGQVGAAGVACALVGAPWYIRNLIRAGFLVPNTAWTDQAARTLANLFPFIRQPENFAISGVIITIGVGWAAWRVWKARGEGRVAPAFLLWWSVPFFAAWWLFVSYDPRFLLLILPMLCALGGGWLDSVVRLLSVQPGGVRRVAVAVAGLAVFLMTAFVVWVSVEYKGELLRAPFMPHEQKLAVVGRGSEVDIEP